MTGGAQACALGEKAGEAAGVVRAGRSVNTEGSGSLKPSHARGDKDQNWSQLQLNLNTRFQTPISFSPENRSSKSITPTPAEAEGRAGPGGPSR